MPDFAGRLVSLPEDAGSWRLLGESRENGHILVLGLGPAGTPPLAPKPGQQAFWLEAPETLAALSKPVPKTWRQVTCEQALELAPASNIFFYMPGLRLAPQFWGKLLARLDLAAILPPKSARRTVWLPGTERQLLHQELALALQNCGYNRIYTAMPSANARSLREAFAGGLPELAISVNFRGLDGDGHIFEMCMALGISLAIWLVDNPWNLLSGIPLPWWRDASIFVTDASFIEELRQYGARHVHFLPLAGAAHMAGCACAHANGTNAPPLFVGRSAFPGKDKFFAGIKIDKKLWTEARQLLELGESPDFHWWSKHCKKKPWPGKAARVPALGAENCSVLRRALWLAAALPYGLRIIGDKGWQELLPRASVAPPVDYYGALSRLYGEAECCLNATSLLLPQSLNQRHFDVWLAGGFLLTDVTKGLGIFKRELVEPVKLERPEQFGEKLAWLRDNPQRKLKLIREWRETILARHLYEHRVREIMKTMAGE